MSESVFSYAIRYVSKDDVIEPDNYNNLVGAIFDLVELFLVHYEQMVEALNQPGLYNYYTTYKDIISRFREKRGRGMYLAGFMTPVYVYHYLDLKDILLATASGLHNLFIYMEQAGLEIPDGAKTVLEDVFQILMRYPRRKSGDVVQPEDHNNLVQALKGLYDVMLLTGFACGKYDVTKYGLCAYC